MPGKHVLLGYQAGWSATESGGRGRIYGEAHHEGCAYTPLPLFSAARFLSHLKHCVFATWLYMVTQIYTDMAKSYQDGQIPTKMMYILTKMAP